MDRALTRRGLVAAAPAAIVAAALPALAQQGLPTFGDTHPDAELLALREPFERTYVAAQAVSPAHSRAEDAYYAAKDAHPDLDRAVLEKMTGLDVAAARWEAALDINSEVIRQIVNTPARTLDGLIFKAKICDREDTHPDLAESIVADLVAMGGLDA